MSLFSGLGGGVPSAHGDVLTARPDSSESRRALIEEIKRRGRVGVVSKNYQDADLLYGKGIEVLAELDDDVSKKDIAIFYSNRSLVRMQMGKIAEALDDADAAVKHDPTYVKAHWRRGQASTACGNLDEALASFRKALELEPKNVALKKEVQHVKVRKEQEEKLLAEAAAAVGTDDAADCSAAKNEEVATKEANSKTKKTELSTSKAKQPPPSKAAQQPSLKEEATGEFSKSDHVRGYKIRADGTKTSFFDREISDDAKKLIGDIAPKKLDPAGGNEEDCAPTPVRAAAEGTSAWNTAGTWEERDVTPWAKDTLTAALLAAEYTLPDGSPSPGARAVVSKVSKLDAHASYATVRGKERFLYEVAVTVQWTLTLGGEDRGRTCTGEMTFPDVDGTATGEYDVVNYTVDGSSHSGTGPLLMRFVRDGGLRDSLHTAFDEWVHLFRATYGRGG